MRMIKIFFQKIHTIIDTGPPNTELISSLEFSKITELFTQLPMLEGIIYKTRETSKNQSIKKYTDWTWSPTKSSQNFMIKIH